MSAECHFCDESEALDRHHIVPRRHGGSDDEENLVTVCPNCHRKLETLYDSRFYDEVMGASEAPIETPYWWKEPVRCEHTFNKKRSQSTWTYGAAYQFICRHENEIRSVGGGVVAEDGLLWQSFQQVALEDEIGLPKESAKHIFNVLRRHGAIYEDPIPMSDCRRKAFKTNRIWYENIAEDSKSWYDEPATLEEMKAMCGGSQ